MSENSISKMFTVESMTAEQEADIARSWIVGRIFQKADESGRLEVVIMNTSGKKIADHFYAEPGEDGQDVYTSISALRSLAGERISERDLKDAAKYGMRRGKLVAFNTITRDMELRDE